MANLSKVKIGLSRLLAVAVAVATVVGGLGLSSSRALAATTTPFSANTSLYMSGPEITLTIDSGSEADSLEVTATAFTVVVSAGSTFTVRYPGPTPGNLANNGGLATCNYSGGDNVIAAVGPVTATFTPAAAPVCNTVPASSGGGGGGGAPTAYAYLLSGPIDGGTYDAGNTVSLSWNAGGLGVSYAKLSLSINGGTSWTTIADQKPTSGSVSWAVPSVTTSQAKIKVEGTNTSGSTMASTISTATFSIVGAASSADEDEEIVVPPVNETPAEPDPDSDPNIIGGFSAQSALNATRSINTDLDITPAAEETDVYCVSGSLIKSADNSAVYYCGADGKRYTFPHERIFYTWFEDFDDVIVIDAETLARIPLGGNVMYRPGRRMIKIESDPKVYAVTRGGVLRWVTTENVAREIYGDDWNQMIDDVNVAFFFSYTIGEPITEADLGLF